MAQENEIKIIVEAEVKKAIKGLKGVQDETEGIGKKTKTMGERLKSGWVGIAAGVTASIVAIKKAFDFSKEFAQFEQSTTAMKNQFGKDADEVIKKLKAVSAGTISNAKLVEGANRAMALNVTKDVGKMADLLEVARFKAQAMGVDTTQAFEDIVTGIGRKSPLILDNLGIITKGWDEEAKAAGVAMDQQFMLNKILKEGQEDIKNAGGVLLTTAEKMQRFGAATENIKIQVGELITRGFNTLEPIITKVLNVISKLPKKVMAVTTALTLLIPVVITVGSLFGPIAWAIMGVSAALGAATFALIDFRTESEKLADTNKKLKESEEELERIKHKGGRSYKARREALKKTIAKLKEEKKALEELTEKTEKHEAGIRANIKAREDELKIAEEKAKKDAEDAARRDNIKEGEALVAQARKDAMKEVAAASFEVTNNILEHRIQGLEAEKQAIQDKVDSGVLSEEAGAKQMSALDAKIRDEKRKQAMLDKSQALVDIAISQAVGHARIWSRWGELPWVAGPLSAALGAVGIAQTAIVASQPIPAYEMGTDFARGGTSMVGEAGPEKVVLPEGAQVIPNYQLRANQGNTTTNSTENFDNRNITLNIQAANYEDFVRKAQQKFGKRIFA